MNKECFAHSEAWRQSEGYAYVPFQKAGRLYSPKEAMAAGTVFPDLDIGIGEYERGLYNGT